MKANTLYTIIAHFFMVLFIYTGLAKLFELTSFRLELSSSPILASFADLLSWALPITELLIVIALFVPKWRLKGLYISLLLMALFTLYILGIFLTDNHVSCSCGGIVENLKPGQHLAFNLICIALPWLGIYSSGRPDSAPFKLRWASTSATLVMLSCIGWILLTAAKAPPVSKTGKEGTVLPSFNFLMLDSTTHLNTENIPTGQSFIMISFSPFCPHCRGEIKDITQNMQKFANTHFYLVSTFSISDLRNFYDKFALAKYNNITVAWDDHNAFLKYFDWHSIPFTTIYDSRKRLAQAIGGRAQIATLSQCINN